ncbi:MAG: DUF4097 domain-containing protein [Candidatus Cloacimonetes bacterium]|nr:DUF4097 domain-containing protein [Candidatus Cloacimonadota bacterium]
MMRFARYVGAVMMLAGAALVAPNVASAQDFSWNGTLSAGQAIEIKGINGEIVAVPASGNQVRVTAVKSGGRRGNADDVRIETVRHDGGVTICAVYPDRRERNECRPGSGGRLGARDNDTKVAFRVEVPSSIDFIGKTVNGNVRANGLAGRVAAETVNGNVEVQTRGIARANTVNGSIKVGIGRADWAGELEFETVNGSIEVAISADNPNMDVEASTVNGSISTDWPLTIQGRWGPKRLNGTIGSGGRTLSLSTVNGSITIARQ